MTPINPKIIPTHVQKLKVADFRTMVLLICEHIQREFIFAADDPDEDLSYPIIDTGFDKIYPTFHTKKLYLQQKGSIYVDTLKNNPVAALTHYNASDDSYTIYFPGSVAYTAPLGILYVDVAHELWHVMCLHGYGFTDIDTLSAGIRLRYENSAKAASTVFCKSASEFAWISTLRDTMIGAKKYNEEGSYDVGVTYSMSSPITAEYYKQYEKGVKYLKNRNILQN